jgi:sodium pump decarboxylase gamma subunit
MTSGLFQSGLILTAIGMGVVFALLTLLVGVIRGMSALAFALGGPPPPAQTTGSPAVAPADGDVLPVITAAVAAYRKLKKSR